jgi:creatinine amidohydrolase/Fe(II)-dependent formamide hydrolase-like protein
VEVEVSVANASTLVLDVQAVSKTFGSLQANDDITMQIRSSAVHALLGENGASPSDIFADGGASIGFDLAKSFPDVVAGDPTVASAELGRAVFDAIVEKVCSITDEYHDMPAPTI